MEKTLSFTRACLPGIVCLFLAVILMWSTKNYQRSDALGCYGHLGAGFPIAFICDDPGGSPLSSAGTIDQDDVINPLGFLGDILFYTVLSGMAFGAIYLTFAYARRILSKLK